jgi:hypothetical protein
VYPTRPVSPNELQTVLSGPVQNEA